MAQKNDLVFADGFWKDAAHLPKEAREKLPELFEFLAEDAFDPRLHTKPLGPPLRDRYSFRVTRDWRVAFRFEGEKRLRILIVDNRDKIYRRLRRIM